MTIKDIFNELDCNVDFFAFTSGIPESTLSDILNGETDLRYCQAKTINKLAKAMDLTVDEILHLEPVSRLWTPSPRFDPVHEFDNAPFFASFRRETLDKIKRYGEEEYVFSTLRSGWAEELYAEEDYPEALYTMGLVDYLAARNKMLRITRYDKYRGDMMKVPVLASTAEPLPAYSQTVLLKAIPQLLKFNFIETPETLNLPKYEIKVELR